MIEDVIVSRLKADGEVCSCLSQYEGSAAIFFNSVPADAQEPYAVLRLSERADYAVVKEFSVDIDYFDYDIQNTKPSRFAMRAEIIFDQANLHNDYYSSIRFFWDGANDIPEADTASIHKNVRFLARAIRSHWIQNSNNL